MPRAATSVATSVRTPPRRMSLSVRLRSCWLMSPWHAAAAWSALQVDRRALGVALGGDEHDALPMSTSASRWPSIRYLCERSSAKCTRCSMASGAACSSRTSTRTGSWVSFAARWPIAPTNVAENSAVWRVAGVNAQMRSTSSMKPHVEHAIGFVQHQHLEVRTVDAAVLDMVEDSGKPAPPGDRRACSRRRYEIGRRHHKADHRGTADPPRRRRPGACRKSRVGASTSTRGALAIRCAARRACAVARADATRGARTPPSCRFRSARSRSHRGPPAMREWFAPGSAWVLRSRTRTTPEERRGEIQFGKTHIISDRDDAGLSPD